MLIAEDNLTSRDALAKHAELNGYDVTSVSDGLEYLVAVSNQKFDIIITDLMMPELNGASATEIMKLDGDVTPILAITALSNDDVRHIKEKFLKVFHKPIDTDELLGYMKTILYGVFVWNRHTLRGDH